MPFYPFLGEGSPTKIDYRKRGTLILTSLLEDLVVVFCPLKMFEHRHKYVKMPTSIENGWSRSLICGRILLDDCKTDAGTSTFCCQLGTDCQFVLAEMLGRGQRSLGTETVLLPTGRCHFSGALALPFCLFAASPRNDLQCQNCSFLYQDHGATGIGRRFVM